MTDPRIEAAARAICEYAHECDGESVQWHEITESLRDVSRRYALRALAAADAAAWRPTTMPPNAGILVHIASSAETGAGQAIALWDYDIGCWRNPDLGMRYAPDYFTRWHYLPSPPHIITIQEVRSDRPIEAKNILN